MVGTPYSAEDCTTHNPDQQNHKYNGKEFDSTHGLNTYDYGARQYNSLVGRWDRIDPMCEKYYSVSPYAYCHNNPVMLTDPNGEDDYFDFYGNYLGTNKEETDYIYVTNDFNRLEDGRCVVGIDTRVALADADLSAEAWSNLATNIFSRMSGTDVSDLHNEKISVTVWNGESNVKESKEYFNDPSFHGDALAETSGIKADNVDARITMYVWPQGTEERSLLNTVSNIQNLIGAHEYMGHYVNGISHNKNSYDKVYHYQMEHSTWKKTTDSYKNYIKKIMNDNGYF
ncbi:MAG: hypothetical protein K6A78_06370 [Prevotella sp.]|nr:hypothetical protein [Prevotella sp.]